MRTREPQPFLDTRLSDLPSNWAIMKLKYGADLISRSPDSNNMNLPFIGLEHIEPWKGRLVNTPEEGNSEGQANHFQEGDVLFGKLRPYLAKVLKAEEEGTCSGELLVLRPRYLTQDYLFYSLLTREFISIVNSSTYGTKMPRANWGFIGNIPMLVPPANEQKEIAQFLESETEKIDELICKKERMIELLQEKRQAIITHAVTKGLNPDTPMRDSGIDWLGKIPKHWKIIRIAKAAKLESGHTPDKKESSYWENGNIPWVSLNDTAYLKDHDYISETAYFTNQLGIENSSARLLPEGAVVFSRDATIGRCAITARPMAVSQHFIAWICGKDLIPEYLLKALETMTGELEKLTMGATLKTIGLPDVKTLRIAIPPIEEQRDIARYVNDKCLSVDRAKVDILKSLELLKEYRQALITAAVTGQIDVRGEVA